jgi:hypothetical protein
MTVLKESPVCQMRAVLFNQNNNEEEAGNLAY